MYLQTPVPGKTDSPPCATLEIKLFQTELESGPRETMETREGGLLVCLFHSRVGECGNDRRAFEG